MTSVCAALSATKDYNTDKELDAFFKREVKSRKIRQERRKSQIKLESLFYVFQGRSNKKGDLKFKGTCNGLDEVKVFLEKQQGHPYTHWTNCHAYNPTNRKIVEFQYLNNDTIHQHALAQANPSYIQRFEKYIGEK